MEKSCRTCKHFSYGKCLAAEDNLNIEVLSKAADAKAAATLKEDLKDILQGELKPAQSVGADGYLDRTEFIINRIIRAVKDMDISQPEQIEVKPKDYNNFYCSMHE